MSKMAVGDASKWLAAMCSHITNRCDDMVGYYSYYSNISRVDRKRKNWPSRFCPYLATNFVLTHNRPHFIVCHPKASSCQFISFISSSSYQLTGQFIEETDI